MGAGSMLSTSIKKCGKSSSQEMVCSMRACKGFLQVLDVGKVIGCLGCKVQFAWLSSTEKEGLRFRHWTPHSQTMKKVINEQGNHQSKSWDLGFTSKDGVVRLPFSCRSRLFPCALRRSQQSIFALLS